jgi:pyruvate formate lyase activating enzyme
VKTAKRDANGVLSFTEEGIKKCPMHLLRVCGEDLECDALCEKLLKNQRILNMGGGVTFSGGEPLMQHEFLFACMHRLKGKLHLAIQTSGFSSESVFSRALALSDYFLYDLKLIDDGMHRRYTGVSNERILRNFSALAKSGVPFTVRVPLIPTVTDTEENIEAIAKLLQSHGVPYVELLPYNKMAGGKYKMVLREYRPCFDESVPVQTGEEIFSRYGIETKIL